MYIQWMVLKLLAIDSSNSVREEGKIFFQVDGTSCFIYFFISLKQSSSLNKQKFVVKNTTKTRKNEKQLRFTTKLNYEFNALYDDSGKYQIDDQNLIFNFNVNLKVLFMNFLNHTELNRVMRNHLRGFFYRIHIYSTSGSILFTDLTIEVIVGVVLVNRDISN